MSKRRIVAAAVAAVAAAISGVFVSHDAAAASSPGFVVYTGYADCPAPLSAGCYATTVTNPAFPSPWYGASGVQFIGDPNVANPQVSTDPDASAIRIDNPSSTTALTVNDVSVTGCGAGTLDLWGTAPFAYPYSVPAKGIIIFSSTSGDNFDGSDGCSAAPTVTVTINGVAHTYNDNIVNGGNGAIPGLGGGDESTPWTKIAGSKVKIDILPAKLPKATINTAYNEQLFAQDSNGAPTFAAASPPPGLAVSATGDLVGTPTAAGTFTFTVTVTDTATHVDSGSRTYKLKVRA